MIWQIPAAGQWTGTPWSAGALEGSDPYLVWADLSAFAGMGGLPEARTRVVVQLDSATTPKEFHANLREQGLGEVNPLYLDFGSDGLRYCTANVEAAFFSAWRDLDVRRYALSQARITDIRPKVDFQELLFDQTRRVLIGVIDDGLPYLHERFRGPDNGTRIVGFWDQDRDPKVRPPYLGCGEIDALIARLTAPPPARASEARLYEEEEYARMRLPETHGAAVLDLAAGGTRHHIACVQLPLNTYADSSGGSLAAQALDACHYICSLAAGQPVVINLSYGGQAGPHDGSGMLEAALDELLTIFPTDLAIVLAAGNSYDADCHARLRLGPRETKTLHWRVQSSDATESFMELWGTDAAPGHPGFDVVVKPPGGQASPAVGPGEVRVAASKDGKPWCAIVNAPLSAKARALLALAPTVRLGATAGDPAPPGDWEVSITNRGAAMTVDAWIERDGPVFRTDIGGKQSTFEDPERRGYIERAATLSNVANGKLTVVVGAHVAASGQMSDYSSAGDPAQTTYRAGPDVSAPGDESEMRPGIEAAGTRSGYVFRMGGTSAAAPQVARLIADFLASQSTPVKNADIKTWLAKKAQSDDLHYPPGDASAPAPERAGAGRIKTGP